MEKRVLHQNANPNIKAVFVPFWAVTDSPQSRRKALQFGSVFLDFRVALQDLTVVQNVRVLCRELLHQGVRNRELPARVVQIQSRASPDAYRGTEAGQASSVLFPIGQMGAEFRLRDILTAPEPRRHFAGAFAAQPPRRDSTASERCGLRPAQNTASRFRSFLF